MSDPSNRRWPETIIFDYGGVITEQPRIARFTRWAAEKFGLNETELLPQIDSLTRRYAVGGHSPREYYNALQELGLTAKPETMAEQFVTLSVPNPKMVSILDALKAQRLELFLMSGSTPEMADGIRSFFSNTFQQMVFSCELKRSKRAPAFFHQAFDLIARNPEDCVYIDDQVELLTEPEEMGATCVHFTAPQLLRQDLRDLGIEL